MNEQRLKTLQEIKTHYIYGGLCMSCRSVWPCEVEVLRQQVMTASIIISRFANCYASTMDWTIERNGSIIVALDKDGEDIKMSYSWFREAYDFLKDLERGII